MRMRFATIIVATACLAGCTTPSHLVFHQTAVIGADVSANATSGQVNVSLGYDRQTDALIPKTQVTELNDPGLGDDKNEAMSAVSASKVVIKGIGEYEVNEQFATGRAAVNLAKRPDDVVKLSTLRETADDPNKGP